MKYLIKDCIYLFYYIFKFIYHVIFIPIGKENSIGFS